MNLIKTNYHTHTSFCDGKNSIEEMVLSAVEKKFSILGFSSHAIYPQNGEYHIALEDYDAYCREIKEAREKYSNQIEIYTGFEADFYENSAYPDFSAYSKYSPDFLIGSVHYVTGNDGVFEADGNSDKVPELINKYFKGNVKEAVCRYFELERKMLETCKFTFLGHPDLIRKQNGKKKLFDENESWYKEQIILTAKAVSKAGVCAEINVGGIARGYMTVPYPSPEFLEILHEHNVPVTINTDCHNKELLDYWYPEAVNYAKKAGYTELAFYTAGSLKFQKI